MSSILVLPHLLSLNSFWWKRKKKKKSTTKSCYQAQCQKDDKKIVAVLHRKCGLCIKSHQKKYLKAADCYSSNCAGIEQIMHLSLVLFSLFETETTPLCPISVKRPLLQHTKAIDRSSKCWTMSCGVQGCEGLGQSLTKEHHRGMDEGPAQCGRLCLVLVCPVSWMREGGEERLEWGSSLR